MDRRVLWAVVIASATMLACPSSEPDVLAFEPSPPTISESDPPALDYARDIRFTRLTANQGVQVELVSDGEETPDDTHPVRLISGRRTLIRGFWSIHADFQPRELVGRLILDYPDDTQIVQDFPLLVDGPSFDGSPDGSFQWLIEPADVVPGIRYRAKILEADEPPDDGVLADPPPLVPLEDRGELALYDEPVTMYIRLVPVQHRFDGCDRTPVVTEELADAYRKAAEQNYPVQHVVIDVRAPMLYREAIGSNEDGFSPLLAALAQQRARDRSRPEWFYYGLVDSCDGFPPGIVGQAIRVAQAPTADNGRERVALGRWRAGSVSSRNTMVHELGHSQGRRHVECSGGERRVDPDYPHARGRIGTWGFGIHDFQLRSPTASRDFMTYCSNEWVSDYGWERALDTLEQLDTLARSEVIFRSSSRLLSGVVDPDGAGRWWFQPGTVASGGGGSVSLETGDGTEIRLDATVEPMPDSDTTVYVEVQWPSALELVTEATLHLDGHAPLHIELPTD